MFGNLRLRRRIIAGYLLPILIAGAVISLVGAFVIASFAVQTVQNAVSRIAASAAQIAATIEEHEQTARSQEAAVNETTATMDELAAAARVSTEQTNAAGAGARQALALSDEGTQVVGRTQSGMVALKGKVRNIAQQILHLSEQISQIGSVTQLVSDLANQTNLLALNAAVEAARAGEQGRGFAVVAAEIRKLADRSKQSAERISALLTEIQSATNATVMVTEEGTRTVEEGTRLTEQTAAAFRNIAAAITATDQRMQQVALNIKQQAEAVGQVVMAMSTISEGARQSAAGIVQTKVGVESLRSAANGLQSMV